MKNVSLRRGSVLLSAAVAVAFLLSAATAQESYSDVVARAQLALDTARLSDAAGLFEQAAAMAPGRLAEIASDRAWTYMRLGNEALSDGKNETADRYYSMAAAIYPEYKDIFKDQWAYTRLVQAQDAVEAASKNPKRSDFRAIEGDLKWVQSLKPGQADAHYVLGFLYQVQGKKDLARREYAAALGGKPVDNKRSLESIRQEAARGLQGRQYVFNLRPIYPPAKISDSGPFETYQRGGFIIHHHNAELAKRVAAVLEYYMALPILDGVLMPSDPFPDECNVYIFANDEEFQATGNKQKWAGAQSKLTVQNGRIVSAAINLFQTTAELTENAVPHELAHIRLAASPYFFDKMPLWLQEGVAMSAETRQKKMGAARVIARARDRGILISLQELFAMTEYPGEGASDIFYAESVAVVESLVEKFGKQRFWAFMKDLKEKDASGAFMDIYHLTVVNVEEMVLGWAKAREQSAR